MYGIDEMHGNTSAAFFAAVHGSRAGDLDVRLNSRLAAPEYRAMSALAYDSTPGQAARLPTHFRVGSEWWPDVRTVLAGLSIRLLEGR